ncbi:unnamed protein product [Cyclocybe aegerita]|uniref:GATA-type domain-containing protein n=1 Tax=Cyclocybe aegerita TaxID=1973307 RepID=A0A8S0XNL9_CYCAE|nr:unnamed protein product [Cyclocybe aegerita]
MASAHQHHRYALPPPNQNDFRLPSLKDLNFTYQSPTGQPDQQQQQQQDHQQQQRQHPAWSRAPPAQQQPPPAPHQQHTPPLSAGHDVATKVDYSKHENGGYAHPGIPLSAQATPVPVNIGAPRSEDIAPSPSQPKRSRNASANMGAPREVRASHPAYPPPHYASYPPSQPPQPPAQYHQIPSGMSAPSTQAPQPAPAPAPAPPPPPAHGQMQHHPIPVSAHPGYAPYQHQYMQPRQPVVHQHPAHQPQQNHSNPYPSPGPPPSAPPPQGPWGQTHPQPQHPPQPPPQQQHQQQQPPPQPQPPPQQHVQHYQQPPAQMPSNQPPPPHMIQQHHQQPPPPPPTPQQHPQQQPQQQPPPPQQQHPQHYQQQPQQQPLSFPSRTTAIVPTNLETRPTTYHEPERVPSARNDPMAEITNHCIILHSFASRYAQLQGTMPGVQPSAPELEEMSQRAVAVVRLLEELRRMQLPEGDRGAPVGAGAVPGGGDTMQQSPDDHRPPKRPWEDISQDEGGAGTQAGGVTEVNGFAEQYAPNGDASTVPQSTAEQDMEIIRTKRATSTAVAAGSAGQPKSKYRKRSRATPPGKCHSCNIRETPEWRRGPDGARTLCNACGLHYAKLMRKRDKANANGEAPHIDLETLRASARAADIAEKASRAKQGSRANGTSNTQAQGGDGDSSMADGVKPAPTGQQHSFQLVNMMAPMPQEQQAVGGSASVGVMDVGIGGAVNGSMANRGGGQQQSQPQQQQQQPPPPQQPQQQPQQQSQPPPQQQQQPQHQPMHSHPPPVTALAPPPPWSRGYTQPEHMQHQSFMRGSATQPR